MIESLPLVVTLFYITAGYMIVAGAISGTVMVASRSLNSRVAYGALALLSLAGAGYQVCCALYYQSTSVQSAQLALLWQMDFASIGLISAYLYIAFESIVRQKPSRILIFAGLLLLVMILANRLPGVSLHFDKILGRTAFSQPALANLNYLQPAPGLGARLWYATMAIVLVWGFGVAHNLWQQVSRRRAIFLTLYIVILLASVAGNMAIDMGLWEGIYPLGFAFALFVLIMSVSLATESVRRSQELSLRDRQMQSEIVERRRVEDKLERLSQVFMQEPAPIHIVDLDGQTLLVNQESIRFLRRDVSAAPTINFFEVLEELNVKKGDVLRSLSEGQECEYGPYYFTAGVPVDTLFVVKDSWINFKLYPIFNQQKSLEECVVRLEDVTEQQFVDNAINTISNAVSTETGQAFFTRLVVYLARLLNKKYVLIGLTNEVNGEPYLETLAAAVDGDLIENFQIKIKDSPLDVIFQNEIYAVERRAQHDFPWQSLLKKLNVHSYVGVALEGENNTPVGALLVMDTKPMEHIEKLKDVAKIFVSRAASELMRLESESTIRKMAFEDQLTGLPNRAELNEHVVHLLKTGVKHCAFIQLDLDHFKTINDALGHDVGDQVIRQLGMRLAKSMGSEMLVARIGGDEFAIVTSRLGEEADKKAMQIAGRISALMDQPVEVGDHLLEVGCTMGVVVFPAYAMTVVDVFRHADIALHRAKNDERGMAQMFTPKMRNEVSKRISLERGLRNALVNDEFELFYQPQVSSAGKLMGAEALLRWKHPKQGYIPPPAFIPVAEETGLINPIGDWVLNTALNTRKEWFEQGVPFSGHLSVNVSAWQLARPNFVETAFDAIKKADVPPSFITLEVTETAVLSDVKDTIRKLAEFRRRGVTIALDDFGTGYSSLAYLRDLPLDILKIDKTFVDVLEIHAQEPLVESMISIGKHMGLQVVAEGVQTPVQLERLKNLGCNTFQGYLFAKPLNSGDFLEWLKSFDIQRVQPIRRRSID